MANYFYPMQNPSRIFLVLFFPFFLHSQNRAWIHYADEPVVSRINARTSLKSHYYTLRSVEGKKVKVHLEELRHELRVSYLHDTLLLHEYFGDYHVNALDSSFLQITYAVRGGSGFGSENIVILAVRDGHLCQTLWLMSSFDAVGFNYHDSLNTDLKLAGNRWDDYRLIARAREYLKDKMHPSGVHKKFQPVFLHFNKDLMAFYGKTVTADSAFNAVEFNQGNELIHFAVYQPDLVIKTE